MSLKTERIKQPVVNTVTQPLKIGGIAEDGADSKIVVGTDGIPSITSATITTPTFIGNSTFEHTIPKLNNTYDLGSASLAWRNIYTNDLHLSNEQKEEGNDIDGTTGDWTIQEGENFLYIINNKTNKKYKFVLEEV